MFNPLIGDLRKVKDAELDNKILDLNKKYFIAAQLGQGGACQQIAVALEIYKSEQQRRHMESSQALIKKQDTDIDDLINVN